MKWVPDRKVLLGGIGGVAAWLIMMGLSYFHIEMPADLQAQLAGGIGLAIAYFVPPADKDIVKRLNDGLVAMAQNDPNIPVTPPAPK